MSRRKRSSYDPASGVWQSADMNVNQYNMYYELLMLMATSIYEWVNLPESIDQRFLEITLFNRGLALFFFDDRFNAFLATQATPQGKINMYNNPVAFHAFASNGYNKHLKASECVPIWSNFLRRPDINAVRIYARRLADIDRAVDVNLNAQKTPIFIAVSESQRLTVINLVKQYTGNEPIILGADGILDPSQMQYISPDAPYIVDKLLTDKGKIWNEIMTILGINNANMDKRERLVADEVNANTGQVEANRLVHLNSRRFACEEINRKYDLNVDVMHRTDFESLNFNVLGAAPALSMDDNVNIQDVM